jgi:hypothetical protein
MNKIITYSINALLIFGAMSVNAQSRKKGNTGKSWDAVGFTKKLNAPIEPGEYDPQLKATALKSLNNYENDNLTGQKTLKIWALMADWEIGTKRDGITRCKYLNYLYVYKDASGQCQVDVCQLVEDYDPATLEYAQKPKFEPGNMGPILYIKQMRVRREIVMTLIIPDVVALTALHSKQNSG